MKKSFSKTEAEKQIAEFFNHIKEKTPKDIKKIQRLAMSYKIKLGERRKTFCKKCFFPYNNPKIRIKKNIKSIVCKNCRYISRWKLNSS